MTAVIVLALGWAMIARSAELPDEGHYALATRFYFWGGSIFMIIAVGDIVGGYLSLLIG